MRNTAKKVSIIMIISMVFCSFTSCKRIQNIKNAWGVSSDSAKYLNCARDCFDSRDVNGLYNLFSEESKQDKYLKQRIELIYYYWDLLDLDDSQIKEGGQTGGMSVREGNVTYYNDNLTVENFYDSDGNCYYYSFYSMVVNNEHPESEGVYSLSIKLCSDTIYKTDADRRDITVDASQIDNLLEREKAVLARIEEAKKDNEYIQADNECRVLFMHQLLDDLITEEIEQYGNSVINKDSIENSDAYDYHDYFPALCFKFIDGGKFRILVHNHPKR